MKEEEVVTCRELGCGNSYCVKCGRKEHRPFHCRMDTERRRMADNAGMDIFQPLLVTPTSHKNGIKRFMMFPSNDLDWSDPLHILYMAAEATFLRMVDRSQSTAVDRRSIKSIEYVENQTSRALFLAKQSAFLAKGINSKEKLIQRKKRSLLNMSSLKHNSIRIFLLSSSISSVGLYTPIFYLVSRQLLISYPILFI